MRGGGCILGFVAALVATPALAQFSLPPDWAERPDGEELSRFYPPLPLALELTGQVIVRCKLPATGVPQGCVVEEETPAGLGFGPAAIRMAPRFQMRPGIGQKPDDGVRIPVRFALPPRASGPPPSPAKLSPTKAALARRLTAALDPAKHLRADYERRIARLENPPPPGVAKETAAAAAQALRSALDVHLPTHVAMLAEAMVEPLSEGELAAYVAFAESPVGRRYLVPDPSFQGRQAQVTQAALRTFREEMRKALCHKDGCEPDLTSFMSDTLRAQAPAKDESAPFPAAFDRRPSEAELAKAWPLGRLAGVTGLARLECTAGLMGTLEDCAVAFESPKELGVAQAAIGLADSYRLSARWIEAGGAGRRVWAPLILAGATEPPPFERPMVSNARALELAAKVVETYEHPFKADAPSKPWEQDLQALQGPVRAKVEAAKEAALEAARGVFVENASALLAERYGEDELRQILGFRTGLERAFSNAVRQHDDRNKAIGQALASRIVADAREAFCKGRDCPPLRVQATGASPPSSTR